MKVECLIPKRNNGNYFPAAIESLINQSSGYSRILISENHSTDGSFETTLACANPARNIEVIVPPSPLSSFGENVAFLLEHVREDTDYVHIASSDDIWLPTFLSEILKFIIEQNGPNLVFCDRFIISEAEKILDVTGSLTIPTAVCPPQSFPFYVQGCMYIIAGALIKADLARRTASLLRQTHFSADWILMMESARDGAVSYLASPLFLYRHHPNSSTHLGKKHAEALSVYHLWLVEQNAVKEAEILSEKHLKSSGAATKSHESKFRQLRGHPSLLHLKLYACKLGLLKFIRRFRGL